MTKAMEEWVSETKTRMGKRYFDDDLLYNLYWCKHRIIKKKDAVLLLDGEPGIGKSTLAHQVCSHIDPEYPGEENMRIADSPLKLLRAIRVAKPGYAINVDEAGLAGLSKDDALNKSGLTITKIMEVCRLKSIFFALCVPSIWNMNKYIRLDRIKCLIHLPLTGSYYVYNEKQIKRLMKVAKDDHEYARVHPEFRGSFIKDVPPQVNLELYDQNKAQTVNEMLDDGIKYLEERRGRLKKKYNSTSETAKILGVTSAGVRKLAAKGQIPATKFGDKWLIPINAVTEPHT